jgi:hypothetical protein
MERAKQLAQELKDTWDPKKNENATKDPYNTLFVGNLVANNIMLELQYN